MERKLREKERARLIFVEKKTGKPTKNPDSFEQVGRVKRDQVLKWLSHS